MQGDDLGARIQQSIGRVLVFADCAHALGASKDGKMAGDFDVKSLESNESLTDLTYTPVPGGVGSITTALLLRHLTEAAREQNRK